MHIVCIYIYMRMLVTAAVGPSLPFPSMEVQKSSGFVGPTMPCVSRLGHIDTACCVSGGQFSLN